MDEAWQSSARKLIRAATHFESLYDEISSYAQEGKPFDFRAEIDEQTSWFRVHVTGGMPPPANASLIVGDFVQNLRASLDHVVCAAIAASGSSLTTRNAFPIFLSPPDRDRRAKARWDRQLAGLAPEAVSLIDHVQPYKQDEKATHDALACLQALSNEDKHRVVLQTVKALPHPDEAAPDLEFEVDDLEEIESYELHAMQPLTPGDILMETAVTITGPKPQVRIKGRLPIELAFGARAIPAAGLAQMFDRIDIIVAHLSNQLLGADLPPQPLAVRLGGKAFDLSGETPN